ncbi:MAG: TonB-dependent receptor [Paludibacter sp.]|nr:TonB-dependent receptor [Bacteroidales bacterium]MCM1069139.1 TonB-dependent receptor [Prevotella sp.]MCM1353578.1 TonB-dependent receptor [Bacteroides sp.]MCM1442739.1 TonB-dependent receptor [Muribaculum sp.]MCM1481625.1 TonB-dependent receptor [Paludibacter sp.]
MNRRTSLCCILFIMSSLLFAQQDTLREVQLREVEANAQRAITLRKQIPATLSVITSQQLGGDYEPSVLPALTEHVPGLFVTSRSLMGYGVSSGAAGTIKVRGVGGMADLLVLVDGMPQYAGIYGHPVADNCQNMFTERIEVQRGPSSLFYGSNAMGGLVNIVTHAPDKDTVHTHIHLQGGSFYTVDAAIGNQVRKGRFFSDVGVGYSRTDGHRPNMNFERATGYWKMGYDLTKEWRISTLLNATWFCSSNPGEVTNPIEDNDMRVWRGTALVSLDNHYERTSGSVRIYANAGQHTINDGYTDGNDPQTQLYLHADIMAGVSASQVVRLFRGNRTTFGFEAQLFGGHAWNRQITDGATSDLVRQLQYDIAGYVNFQQHILSWLAIDAGLRVDWHSVAGLEWVPAGGVSFIMPYDASMHVAVGKGFRNPTIRELYMYRPANQELKAERMWNYELSWREQWLKGRLQAGLSIFFLQADNIIETVMQDGRPRNMNTGKVQNCGLEAEMEYSVLPELQMELNYSFLHMKYPVLAAPEHKFYAGLHYRREAFGVSTGLQYVAGLYKVLGDIPEKENFLLWNIQGEYRIWKGLRVFLRADNILAQRYEIIKGFPMPRATLQGGFNWIF